MTYAWMYLQDVVTSPVVIAAFGLGCIFSGTCGLLAIAYANRVIRHKSRPTLGSTVRIAPPNWEGPMWAGKWLAVSNLGTAGLFKVSVVDEDSHTTWTATLQPAAARSLTNWLNERLKGVPQ